MLKKVISTSSFLIVFLITALLLVLTIGCAGSGTAGLTETGGESVDSAAEKEKADEPAPIDSSSETRGSEAPDEKGLDMDGFMTEELEEAGSGSGKTAYEGSGADRTGISVPSESGLKAGFADDNKQYGYFINFLEEFNNAVHLPLDVSERITLQVTDSEGKPVSNASVEIFTENRLLESGKAHTDGTYLFFPSQYPRQTASFEARIKVLQQTEAVQFSRADKRTIGISLNNKRSIPDPVPLDIVFIMDTTGSMGEEIDRLKTTIELIHLNLTSLSIKPEVRFGMVLYKDVDDEYRTKTIPLTSSLDRFQEALNLVEASGGGDTPEDLQAALEKTIREIDWNPRAVKMGFIITDAPPHLDYGQQFTYVDASERAKEKGIKIYSVGTGGLDINGEYVLRQISQYTSGKYIFLTYGEAGESEGGRTGSVSHHTGSNFQTDKLEAIIIRFAKEELSYLTDEPIEKDESYFVANKIGDEEREKTLEKLFSMALGQLIDYATIKIDSGTPTALLPIITQKEEHKTDAEYFAERLLLETIGNPRFRVVERDDLQAVMEELKLQLSGLTKNSEAVKVGKLMNAELIISGDLYRRDTQFELFLKLLRVESGEILSVTKARIDTALGLSGE